MYSQCMHVYLGCCDGTQRDLSSRATSMQLQEEGSAESKAGRGARDRERCRVKLHCVRKAVLDR